MIRGPISKDTTITRSGLASLAGVTRAAVTNWRKRHDDFPQPVDEAAERFDLVRVLDWLDSRVIPAALRTDDEADATTYADRVRRRLAAGGQKASEGSRSVTAPVAESGSPVRALLGPLSDGVRGSASRDDYLFLLLCLAFLRIHSPERWSRLVATLPSSGTPATARALLRRLGGLVDDALGPTGLLGNTGSTLARLQPRSFEQVKAVFELSRGLTDETFQLLREKYTRRGGSRGDGHFTPPSVTRVMVALLERERPDGLCDGRRTVYDPYARGGELLAEVVRSGAAPATTPVRAEGPHPDDLRLAGMNLALLGASPRLAVAAPPWERPEPTRPAAALVLTNPPFGNSSATARRRPDHDWPFGVPPTGNDNYAWLQHCVESLAPDGRAAVLMPYAAGFSAGQHERDIRRAMVERGAVVGVVALPARLFPRTSVAVCVWLLRPATGPGSQVLFVDASHLGTKSGVARTLSDADIAAINRAMTSLRRDHGAGRPHVSEPGLAVAADLDTIRAHGYSLNPAEYQRSTPVSRTAATAEVNAAMAGLAEAQARSDRLRCQIRYGAGDTSADWPRPALRDLCQVQAGPSFRRLAAARRSDGDVPVVYPRHLRDGRVDARDVPGISEHAAWQLERFALRAGDILCVRTGAMGPPAIAEEAHTGWILSTNLLRVRILDTSILDPGYLLAFMSQPWVFAWIRARSKKSLGPSLDSATFGELEIPTPSLGEQHRIVEALLELDRQTASYERLASASRHARTLLAQHLTGGAVALS